MLDKPDAIAELAAGGFPAPSETPMARLVAVADTARVDRAAVILALADDIEERCPRGRPIRLSLTVGRSVTVRVPILGSWRPRTVAPRFERAFGKPLDVIPGSGSE